MERGLVAGLASAAESPKHLTGALMAEGRHGGAAPIGGGRARDLAVNAVLPLLHSLSGGQDSPLLDTYRRFPKLQGNGILGEMASQLLPEEWWSAINSARRQQGLLHLALLLRGGG